MNHLPYIITGLAQNAIAIQALLADVTEDMARWRPAPGKWNLLEVMCHMRDEETDDFGRRLRQVLEDPTTPPPPIDPEAWVNARSYETEVFWGVMQSFGDARKASIAYLEGLQQPDWQQAWQHPKLGPLSAKLFVNNWLAHDYLHMRQILGIKFAYLRHISGEDLGYAGTW